MVTLGIVLKLSTSKIYCGLNIEPHCFYVCAYQRCP